LICYRFKRQAIARPLPPQHLIFITSPVFPGQKYFYHTKIENSRYFQKGKKKGKNTYWQIGRNTY
ncbi:MAG TPA: hypothetical protein VK469_05535, partial [Candidatus Kapabacteria bacterium]|nr:hypothetical protein [Candidatus Kapabacteria bacterium]